MRGTWRDALALIAALTVSVGAAEPPFNSYETYVGRGLHRVMVFANVADVKLRKHIESRITGRLVDRRIQAIQSMTVLPLEYQFADLKTDSLIGSQGADALLVVEVGAPGQEAVPFPVSPSTARSHAGAAGPDSAAAHAVRSQRWSAARGAAWPWSRFKAVVYATRTGQAVWSGIATGRDEQIRRMVDAYCDEVVRRIAAVGVLAIVAGLDLQGAIDAPYVIHTDGGGQQDARAMQLTGNGLLHIVDPAGKDVYISASKVHSIFDRFGIDRTYEVLMEGKTLP
jgi:hypothetical protein